MPLTIDGRRYTAIIAATSTKTESKQMTNEIAKLTSEIEAFNAKYTKQIADNKVGPDFPVLKRTYTYRKSTKIRAHDLAL